MSTILTQTQAVIQEANDSVVNFISRFQVGNTLRKCRAHKTKGFSVIEIFRYLLGCMFSQTSTYMSMRIGTYKESFSKNTIYRFCDDAGINWHKFVRMLSSDVIDTFLRPTTSEKRTEYFIIDDTPFAKSGKKTELVSKFFNHVSMKYEKGFRVLALLWSDGYSNIPVELCPLASGNKDLLVCPAKKVDGRSVAGKIRKKAQQKAPDLIMDMLKNAISAGHKAKYVLFDSWFSFPRTILTIKNELKLDVLAMIKKSSKVNYEYNGKSCNIRQIYNESKKKRGRSKYLLSVDVNLVKKENGNTISKIPARIVCVRNRSNKKDWIAIISTDMSLSEEEIIRHYGNRWNIEVFFKTCKQFLKLLKESNSTSFDAFTCHLSIVAVRYMMLSVYERTNSDDRTIGELFYMFTAGVAEISFSNALNLIVAALVETVREYFHVSDEQIAKFTELFIKKLPEYIKNALLFGSKVTIPA